MLIYSNLRFPPINSDSETYRDKRLSAGVLARLSGKHTLPISGGWPPPRLVTTGLWFRFFFFHLGPLSRYRSSGGNGGAAKQWRVNSFHVEGVASAAVLKSARHLRPLAVREERERERSRHAKQLRPADGKTSLVRCCVTSAHDRPWHDRWNLSQTTNFICPSGKVPTDVWKGETF